MTEDTPQLKNTADVIKLCADTMRPLGFEQEGEVFLLPLGDGLVGRATFHRSRSHGLTFHTWVGVHHPQVEALLMTKSGKNDPSPTVARQLGYLMPKHRWRDWDFGYEAHSPQAKSIFDRISKIGGGTLRNGKPTELAKDIAQTVAKYGLPWMHRMTRPDDLLAELESDPTYAARKLPAFLVILGRTDEARAVLAQELQRRKHHDFPDIEEYEEFAARLVATADPT